ncbi:MAG: NAD(P)-dependent oxidoreductase [Coriobacteriales bacterium]|jgi:3-hydroxyisobutyrate dehydrogenase|nr:NAD(P)-dependent oxidoreductase [Coriobacteriales bacterium]
MKTTDTAIAFIWQDVLGAALAQKLARNGYEVRGFARGADAVAEVPGVQAAATIAEAIAGAAMVFTLFEGPQEVEEVYLGSGGIFESAKENTYFVDLTTSNPRLARELHALASVHDSSFVDAPVEGGAEGFETGLLRIYAGGEDDSLGVVAPVLQALTPQVFEMGLPGTGMAMRIASIIAVAGNLMSLVEALAFAGYSGIAPERMGAFAQEGPAASAVAARYTAHIAAEDFKTGGGLRRFHRELTTALDAADELDMAFPTLETAHQLFDLLVLVGGGDMGLQTLALIYREEEFCNAQGLDWALAQRVMDVYDRANGYEYDYDDDDCDDPDCGHHHGHSHHHDDEDDLPGMGGYFSPN